MNHLNEHFKRFEKVYAGLGQFSILLALIISCLALMLAHRGAQLAQDAMLQQITLQQETMEKQISFQVVQAEWAQDWVNWHEAVRNLPPGSTRPDQPGSLRKKLIAAGVLRRDAK